MERHLIIAVALQGDALNIRGIYAGVFQSLEEA